MRNSVKQGRLLAAFVLLAVGMASASLAIGALSGRDYVRCIKACNATRKACQNQCAVDCHALYGTGAAYTACNAACRAICATESDACKLVCAGGPPPPTEECP